MIAPLPLTVDPDAGIPMPDGTRLSAQVWRPAGPDRFPAILEFIPYRKRDGTAARDATIHPWMAARGYACLRVDLRGHGDSGGIWDDEYSPQELADACAVIAWAAAQDWCTGRVGMMGKSWGAFNALQTAALRPPGLGAVIAVCGTVDRFADDIHFKGGALLGENFRWGSTMLGYAARPPDPALRPGWRDDWLSRLAALPFLPPVWAAHQRRDAYWRHGSVAEDFAAIEVPVLGIGGLADGYVNMIPGLLDGLAGRAQAILGPWAHLYPHTALPGPQAGFPSIALRWWDRWLKGLPNGAEADPPLRVYLERSAPPDASARHRPGDWIALGSVPAAQVEWGLSPGRLAPGPCAPLCEVVDSPQQIGMAGGAYFPTGLAQELPGDQAGDDALSVCFDSAPLEAPLALLGRPVLEIALSCDTPRGHLVARLCDVAPEGSSRRIAHGVLNLCHRDSAAAPRDVPPGQVLHLTLPLDMMAHRLMPGHRLRLALSTACFPLVWPAPDRARLTLHAGQLMLPCPADDAPPCTLPPAESPQPGTTRALSPARAGRQVETDPDGTRTLVIATDSGAEEIAAHGLIHRETCTERWQIRPDDPLSARADIDWTHEMSRGGWQVRVETRSTMTADATHLHMTAEAVARDGRAEIARRNWSESVPRDWV